MRIILRRHLGALFLGLLILSWGNISKGEGATPSPLVVGAGHREGINQMVYSPDSSLLASAGKDCLIVIRDAATGAWRTTLAHKAAVNCLAFARDSVKLAAGDADSNVVIWNAQSGKVILSCREQTVTDAERKVGVLRVAFSADGKQLAAASAGVLRIWDTGNAALLAKISTGLERSALLAFSSDGQQVYAGGDGEPLQSWQARTGAAVKTLALDNVPCYALAISPDSRTVAFRTDKGPIAVWDIATGNTLTTIAPPRALSSITFTPDSKRLLGALNMNLLVMWNADKGEILQAVDCGGDMYVGNMVSIAASADGKTFAAATNAGVVKLWDAKTGKLVTRRDAFQAKIVQILAGSLPGTPSAIVAGYEDGSLRVWDAASGKLVKTLLSPERKVFAIALAPSGSTLAVCLGYESFSHAMETQGVPYQEICYWDTQSWTLLRKTRIIGYKNGVTSLAFSPDGQTLAGGADAIGFDSVRLWDVKTGEINTELTQTQILRPRKVAFSKDGKLVASASEATTGVQIWKIDSGTPFFAKQDYTTGRNEANALLFLPGGNLVKVTEYGIRIFDTTAAKWLESPEKVSEPATGLTLSPDAKLLASTTKTGRVKLWTLPDFTFKNYLNADEPNLKDVAFLANSRSIATAHTDGSIKIWSAASGDLLATLLPLPTQKTGEVEGEWIAWTPQGYYAGSGDAAKYVRIVGNDAATPNTIEQTFSRPAQVQKALAR